MLNLLAATGHVHYVKCSRIYLQMMVNFQHTHPRLYQRFAVESLFVARHSERFCAAIWPDLFIEQLMMKTLRSRRGLTRGNGCTDIMDLQYATASYHNAPSYLTQTQHRTSY